MTSLLDYVNIRVLGATTLAQAGGSRAIMAPGGGGGLTGTVSWQLWSKRSERSN